MSEIKREQGFVHFDAPDDNGTVVYDGREVDLPRDRRFERVERLLTPSTLELFQSKHVVVFGVGGVGSFAAESLARSGVGKLTLVDFDVVCETNINRQIPALTDTVGMYKVDALIERCSQINPHGYFIGRRALYHANTSENLLESADFVVDAIDNVTAKLHLISTCLKRKLPIVASMGAGGKLDPTRVQVTDLAKTHSDALARAVRRLLRQQYGFDTTKKLGVPAVFSPEPRVGPYLYPGEENTSPPQGTLSCVTGAFGLIAASVVIKQILQSENISN